jgi:uncharacterized iron-regulated membrane protein
MMAQITSETIFWSLFCALQFLSSIGFGTIRFNLTAEDAKVTSVLIASSYLLHSGFFVSVDNVFINGLLCYGMVLMFFHMIYTIIKHTVSNIKIVNLNIQFISQ